MIKRRLLASKKRYILLNRFTNIPTWEFGPELPAAAGHAGLDLLEHLVADAEQLVLARPQLVDEARAPLGVLPAVEGVQLGGHGVQVQVGEVEPRDQRLVRPLRAVQQLPEVVHLGARWGTRGSFALIYRFSRRLWKQENSWEVSAWDNDARI